MTRKPILAVAAMILSGCVSLALAQHAADRVQVRYLHPEKFTDAGRYWAGAASREDNLAQLARHIERRATGLLPEGQRLLVSVTDVDLAGGYEPWRNLGAIRVVRDVHPPRIDLSFQLTGADGRALREGKRSLRDLAFQVSGSGYRDDPLRYEKALINGWLARELQPAH